MWIFLPRYGFFSAVCARTDDGGYGNPIDTDRINLRARDRRHLELLIKDFTELSGSFIIETPDTDYACRIICPKQVWASVLMQVAMSLDYDNFKGECHKNESRTGAAYGRILPEVWGLTRRLQE